MSILLDRIGELERKVVRLSRQLREMRRSRDHWRTRCLGKVKER